MQEAISVLEPYLERIKKRRGLSRSMNRALKAHPIMVDIISRTAELLVRAEAALDFSGQIRMSRMQLYNLLLEVHPEWVVEVPRPVQPAPIRVMVELMDADEPVDPEALADHPACAGHLVFDRVPLFPFHVFHNAMSIARRVGLIAGHGRSGLHPELMRRLGQLGRTSAGAGKDGT